MLIECPECKLQLSDKAISCPHCGYPMNSSVQYRKPTKRLRLPNGFGQITRIKGKNLRNPYRVMVTVGKTETGKPISKLLRPQAYFATYNDAYAALAKYNRDPYEINNTTTLSELYDMWKESKKYKSLKETTKKAYESMWRHCAIMYAMPVMDIRLKHIRMCMDSFDAPNAKKTLRALLTVLLDYAIQFEIIDRNVVKEYKLEDSIQVQKEHIVFTDDEIDKFWKYNYAGCSSWVLIQCYTGMRPKELVDIKLSNVNITDKYIIGGIKTKAGTNRIIPIHSKIMPLIKKLKEQSEMRGAEYLITENDNMHISYEAYQYRFKKLLETLDINMNHRLHDPRKHFVTMAKKYNVDEYAIKRIVGHSISDLTEKVYTERNLEWLQSEIEKIV